MIDTSKLTYQEQWELISTLRHFKIEEIKVGNDNKIRVILVSDEK